MIRQKIFGYEAWIQYLCWLSLICAGLFHAYTACFFAAAMAVLLLMRMCREGKLQIRVNMVSVAIFSLAAGYALSCLWAVDRGLAFIGFVKYLPVPVFLLLLMQQADVKSRLLAAFPYVMAVLAGASILLSSVLGEYLLVADRLAGFLQYPNTFALLLLAAQLQLTGKREFSVRNICVLLILIVSLLYTGSRTVFVLAVASNAVLAAYMLDRKKRWLAMAVPAVAVAVVIVAAALSGSDVLQRFLRFSLTESTFAGRLLYAYDALPLIFKHPFGTGSMGFYYLQQSVQTGVYSTMYVHNDLLQLMLDIGWIPALLWLWAVLRSIFRKGAWPAGRIVAAVMLIHSFFDFDLQFMSVYFVFLLFLDTDSGKSYLLRPTVLSKTAVGVLAAVSLYMGAATVLPEVGLRQLGQTLYPWNTANNAVLITRIEDLQQADGEADRILRQNPYVNIAHSVKAHYAYASGDFAALMERKALILQRFPFQYAEYEEYCRMLVNGAAAYQKAGDTQSAAYCLEVLKDTVTRLNGLTGRLSPLGRVIKDQPVTQLPRELAEQIEMLLGD